MLSKSQVSAIKTLNNESKGMAIIFSQLKKMDYELKIVDVNELIKDLEEHKRYFGADYAIRRAVVHWMQQLAEIKIGNFIPGRRGRPSRFEWDYPIHTIAQLAGESDVENQKFTSDETTPDNYVTKVAAVSVPTNTWITFQLPLQQHPEHTIRMQVPTDLTKDEARSLTQQLSAMIVAIAS